MRDVYVHLLANGVEWAVFDTADDSLIAVFYNKRDAEHFADWKRLEA